jgi:uncharacterized protein YbjT (DUF2867 family)
MKLLLAGATGLVGRHLLEKAIADPRVTSVVCPVRRPLPPRPKLLAPVVDFDHLPTDAPWWKADAALCALGTTMRVAGSREAFWRVDHDYPLDIARHALAAGTPTFVLNSALGANAGSAIFYNRVKGEVEKHIAALGFASLTLVRPGLIGGVRDGHRPAEQASVFIVQALGRLLPRRLRINPAAKIAEAMLDAALAGRPGEHVVDAADLC